MIGDYRIVEHPNGFEPQMCYTMGAADGEKWFPLNELGFWVEPDAFSHGKITRRMIFDLRADAMRAIIRAKATCGTNLQLHNGAEPAKA